MPDTLVISANPSSLRSDNLYSYLKLNHKRMTAKELKFMAEITGILEINKIDQETALGILKSFELKHGAAEETSRRVEAFCTFLKSVDTRQDFIDGVKNLGMLSKAELEDQARETGDWIPVIKRNNTDAKKLELMPDDHS